ncbi:MULTISPECIES: hypothetical protein [Acetobacterium]|jgi:hypothetical protein|uniref:Prenylated flavin chaperone LpdD-like domain-containing protein n=1 Tax=Acetobacterium wieringae TaxID=52694 RepID=A0A1F2PNH2_9FIRM|nr:MULTISPECIES: hypothetical protein [Acetobacterium]OFV72364.1 hypothetical protein ACWI_02750 [Acetobacterium wieringae]
MDERIKLTQGTGKTALNYEITPVGKDILILLTGGDAHIGCTAIGDDGRLSSYTPQSHKDDALAIPLAKKVSQNLHCVCTVVAGFHLDDITREEIAEVVANAEQGMTQVLEAIEKN